MLECVPPAQVAKLVDAPDLGSGVEIRGGSSPFLGTIKQLRMLLYSLNPLQAGFLLAVSKRDGLSPEFRLSAEDEIRITSLKNCAAGSRKPAALGWPPPP